MAKRTRAWNKAIYERYLKEGRGQGEGSTYRPWISVHDFSSRGTISRIAGHKAGRVHHFLSRNELNYFYLLEWSNKVLDIREQYPLIDVALAADIARRAGISYPRDNVSSFPYVMTCDFMVTTPEGLKARTVKHTTDLRNPRTVEKLEIERRYWGSQGIDWRIVTEREIPMQMCHNIAWLYTSAVLPAELDYTELKQGMLYLLETGMLPAEAAVYFDERFVLPPGSGLRVLKHLLWTKRMPCDMNADLSVLCAGGCLREVAA
jgi:hypothetical protein